MMPGSFAHRGLLGIGAALGLAVVRPALAQSQPEATQPPPAVAAPPAASELPPLPPPATAPDSAPEPAHAASPAVPPPPASAPRGPVGADDLPPREAKPERRELTWYGMQIIAVDAASVVLVLAGAGAGGQGGQVVADVGAAGYFLGGPVVHFAHENVGKGFGSLGLRVVVPFGGALLGAVVGVVAAASASQDGMSGLAMVGECSAAGFLLGLVAAPVIDAAFLAYATEPADVPAPRPAASRLQLVPVAALPRDGAGRTAPTFGVLGRF